MQQVCSYGLVHLDRHKLLFGFYIYGEPVLNTPPPVVFLTFSLVQQDTMETGRYGRRGSPWEFNLRDVFRWCELMLREQQPITGTSRGVGNGSSWEPWLFVDTLYIQRMRTSSDREAVLARFKEEFPEAFNSEFCSDTSSSSRSTGDRRARTSIQGGIGTHPVLKITPDWMQVGQTVLPRGCWSNPESRAGDCVDGRKAGLTMPLALRRPLQVLAR